MNNVFPKCLEFLLKPLDISVDIYQINREKNLSMIMKCLLRLSGYSGWESPRMKFSLKVLKI